MKIINVEYVCTICSTYCKTTNHNLRYRKHYKNEYYCQKCIIRLTKKAHVFNALPCEHHQQIHSGCIDYELAIKYLVGIRTNTYVHFVCGCGKECKIKWNKLQDRQYAKLQDVCYTCLQSNINNSESKLKEHRERSKKLWTKPQYRANCIAAFERHNKKMQTDVEYARLHKRRSRSVSGNEIFSTIIKGN